MEVTGSEFMVDEKAKEAFLRNLVRVTDCRFLITGFWIVKEENR
jgi:hypothetical protein